jgi:predicted glycosyltransferase
VVCDPPTLIHSTKKTKLKILTDLGHPKNVHVLKNLNPLLAEKGHELHCVYRDREHIEKLCRAFGISGTNRGKGGKGIFGKFLYLLKTDYQLFSLARKIKPDLLLSFGSPYLANLSVLAKIPMIVLDDTEQNRLVQRIYSSCSAAIVVPACFGKTLSRRQICFNGYFELAYLSPRYFRTDPSIFKELGLAQWEKYVLLRFVSWNAVHDINHRGLNREEMQELATSFSGLARVFISAEGELPEGLESLRLKLSPELIHQFMAHSALVFSEGATMAAETAVLAVPTVYCSDLRPGYIDDLEKKHDLLSAFSRSRFDDALAKGMDLLRDKGDMRLRLSQKRKSMLAQAIDVTAFMAWFIDQFPMSMDAMLADPSYPERFKP